MLAIDIPNKLVKDTKAKEYAKFGLIRVIVNKV